MEADKLIQRHNDMKAERATLDDHLREVAERVFPRENYFQSQHVVTGEKKTERLFDATAPLALERFGAAMESMLTPRTQRWHKLRCSIAKLNEDSTVKRYLDELNDALFESRYSAKANFASQIHEVYLSLGAFGSGGIFIEDVLGVGIRYKSLHLAELFFLENYAGIIDTVHREFEYSARQAVQRFGVERVPDQIKQASMSKPESKWKFIHCLGPREDYDRRERNAMNMPYYSTYVSLSEKQTVSVSGYRTFPIPVSRYVTAPRETYGRSPAMTVLPEIKMINEMSKTVIRAAHRVVDPPLLLFEDGALEAMDLRPSGINPGGLDSQGRQLVQPLQTNARVDIGLDMMDQRRKVINDAFLVTLFQILVENPQMTATEALMRAQEKGALLAPTMGRQQSELLGRIIERELDILGTAGVLPEMPDQLLEAGGEVTVEYSSPLNKAMRAEEGVAMSQWLEALTPLAQIKPEILDIVDEEEFARTMADIAGVPAKVVRPREVVAQKRGERAQQAQAAALLQAAPIAGKTAKDLAQAQQIAGTQPNQTLLQKAA